MAKFTFDKHFKFFSQSLQELILGYGVDDEDFTKAQKAQVENLIKLERKFKKMLQQDSRGHLAYKKFIEFIWRSGKDSRRNTLAARPYFRERQGVFSKGISPAIQKKKFKRLYRFNINLPFIAFVLNAVPWGKNSKIRKAASEVYLARKGLIEKNMPLAISRARIFRQKTPESHLSYMDMVQISMEGLINAVDKFVLPYSPVFRSVVIGRATGDLIESFSDKMLHFYPSDRRKIYRANKALKDRKDLGYDGLAEAVNDGTVLENPTNPAEIHSLMLASSHFSLEMPAPSNGERTNEGTLADIVPADDSIRPDVIVENNQLAVALKSAYKNLNTLEVKYLRMKGVDISC